MTLTRTLTVRAGLVLAAAGVLTLSACAGSTTASSTPAATGAPSQAEGGAPGGGGISGEIAAIAGATLQVQSSDSQTAVSYSDSTSISKTVAAALSDVTAGVCVTTLSFGGGTDAGDGSTDAAGSDSAGTDSAAADSTGAATSVVISAAVDGACETAGPGGGGGGFPGGDGAPPTDLPDGATPPTDAPDGVMPTGAPGDSGAGGGGGFGGFASGLVTAVSGSTITVETTDADGASSSTEIAVDDSTSYTSTVTADSSALVVGACVTAQGEADDSGAGSATSLTISEADENGCSTGFGGAQGGPGGMGGQRPSGSGSGAGSSSGSGSSMSSGS